MRQNAIGDAGAIALADLIQEYHYLTELYVGGNNIQSKGFSALAESLKNNRSIVLLDVQVRNFYEFSPIFH